MLACITAMTVQDSIGCGVFLGHLTIGISFRVILYSSYISRKMANLSLLKLHTVCTLRKPYYIVWLIQ